MKEYYVVSTKLDGRQEANNRPTIEFITDNKGKADDKATELTLISKEKSKASELCLECEFINLRCYKGHYESIEAARKIARNKCSRADIIEPLGDLIKCGEYIPFHFSEEYQILKFSYED